MSDHTLSSGSSYLLAIVAGVLLLLIVPAASAASRRLKPAWRAWVWPLVFGALALTSLCAALATMLNIQDSNAFLWKAVNGLAGLSFTFLTLNALYRAVPDGVARRFAPLIWIIYTVFLMFVLMIDSFLPVLVYDGVCSILVFLVYSTLYARNRDQAADAQSIIIGTGLVLVSDLLASFDYNFTIGPFSFNQLLPFSFLEIIALVFFYLGASASYSVKYDMQRSRERALSSR